MISTATTASKARGRWSTSTARSARRRRWATRRGRSVTASRSGRGDDRRRSAANCPARQAAREMGVEQTPVDAELLAVRPRRDGLTPSLARHGHQVAGRNRQQFPASCGRCSPTIRCGAYAAAAAEGDNVAVAELVRRTESAVWQLCAVLGSDGETEDLVQETYLRALRALPRFRGDAPVRLWLLSIARRTCADHVRRRQRQRRLVDRMTHRGRHPPDGRRRRRPLGDGRPAPATRSGSSRGVRPDAARRAELRGGGRRRRVPDRHDPIARRPRPRRPASGARRR